ncbi:hypothetical protein Ddye_026140 [Dipteronia dyeriana]|uniref:Uncharacterized protein n=1 Tax=Dipteronia dyeriana TaxID=168575 RepID=A0AAD9TLM1_9ROSI|nr:hypothetical protein Ddye_026140 [Dipteronia dyeriana]
MCKEECNFALEFLFYVEVLFYYILSVLSGKYLCLEVIESCPLLVLLDKSIGKALASTQEELENTTIKMAEQSKVRDTPWAEKQTKRELFDALLQELEKLLNQFGS